MGFMCVMQSAAEVTGVAQGEEPALLPDVTHLTPDQQRATLRALLLEMPTGMIAAEILRIMDPDDLRSAQREMIQVEGPPC